MTGFDSPYFYYGMAACLVAGGIIFSATNDRPEGRMLWAALGISLFGVHASLGFGFMLSVTWFVTVEAMRDWMDPWMDDEGEDD